MIVGIFRGPSKYSPYNNYEGTLQRRDHVINRMIEEKYISREQGEAAKQEGLNVLPLYRGDSEFAAHFREEVRKYLEQTYGVDALYKKGMKAGKTGMPCCSSFARCKLLSLCVMDEQAKKVLQRKGCLL